MSRRRIAEVVGPEAAALVSRIERAEMEFGVHHRWTDEQVFTEAGVQVLVEKLAETHAGPALALRAEARRIFTPVAAPLVPLARGMVVTHSPLNGYMPEPEVVE
jgi:hypothetical protein